MNKLLLSLFIMCAIGAGAQSADENDWIEKEKQKLEKQFTNPDTYLKEAYKYVYSLGAESREDLYNEYKLLTKDAVRKRYDGYNFSKLFSSVNTNNVIGFIGANYQRFYIHINNVKQDTLNPKLYHITGKSKVKNTICSYKGTFLIKDLSAAKVGDKESPYNGFLVLEYKLLEDSSQTASGLFHGVMYYRWNEDAKRKIQLEVEIPDNPMGAIGIWKSYGTNLIKRCNWGYGEIDLSIGLSKGDCCFYINEKYAKSGWEDYILTYDGTVSNTTDTKQLQDYNLALKREEIKWWK